MLFHRERHGADIFQEGFDAINESGSVGED